MRGIKALLDGRRKRSTYLSDIDGKYAFCFGPTGIGTAMHVRPESGEEIDISGYEAR